MTTLEREQKGGGEDRQKDHGAGHPKQSREKGKAAALKTTAVVVVC